MDKQLIVNIKTIIEYLWRVPGVVSVEVEEPQCGDLWERRVWVTFAGSAEKVGIEFF